MKNSNVHPLRRNRKKMKVNYFYVYDNILRKFLKPSFKTLQEAKDVRQQEIDHFLNQHTDVSGDLEIYQKII